MIGLINSMHDWIIPVCTIGLFIVCTIGLFQYALLDYSSMHDWIIYSMYYWIKQRNLIKDG